MTTTHATAGSRVGRGGRAGAMLRAWRTSRGKSQLALAVEAGISTRHLSFMENGRSTPSREMVLTLAEHLDLPFRDRNSLLEAAGYAAVFRETPLEAEAMTEVRAALSHILAASEPNPALVVNRRYDVLLSNSAAIELFSFFAPDWTGRNNIAYLLLSDDGLKPAVADWPGAAAHLIRRLRAELGAGADARDQEVLALADCVQSQLGDAILHAPNSPGANILVPVTLRRAAISVDLFTTITTLGTPLDITLQELRIETFFPASPQSRAALASILNASCGV